MKYLFLLGISAFVCCNTFAQLQPYNWTFGDSVGLDFSTNPPTFFKAPINALEASATISNDAGELLFYTNGEKVWNKNLEVMPNGDSLNIGLVQYGNPSSITQGVTIIPKPGSLNLFYIIYMSGFNSNFPDDTIGLEYSLVDMTLDGGLGDIVAKNIQFWVGFTYEKMQAVKHANGRDWWLMLTTGYTEDSLQCFLRFLITPDSIFGPYSQFIDIGDIYSIFDGVAGQMKFSQDGSRLAFTRSLYFDIYDFNRCTGEVSNVQTVKNTYNSGFYGCEFSNDGRMVYAASTDGGTAVGRLYQYCLDCFEPIADTKEIIYKNEFDDYTLGQLQLGPDGKIYFPIPWKWLPNDVYSFTNQNMSVINNPNAEGLACDFDTLTISLGDSRCSGGLPNMPNYNLGALEGSPCDTLLAINNTNPVNIAIKIYPNPSSETIKIVLSQAVKIISIKTFNYLGKEIEISFDENLNAVVKNIANGFYITEIITEKGKLSLSWEKL